MGWDGLQHELGCRGTAAHKMVISRHSPWALTPPHGPGGVREVWEESKSMSTFSVRHVLHSTSLAHWGSCCRRKMLSPRSGKVWCCTSTATRFLVLWPIVITMDQDETQYEA